MLDDERKTMTFKARHLLADQDARPARLHHADPNNEQKCGGTLQLATLAIAE